MNYTVKQGDTLSKIARDVLGDIRLWPAIAELNNLSNPDLIFPGQVLLLPDKLEPLAVAEANRVQKAGVGPWGWLLLALVTGGFIYHNRHELRLKAKKAIATVKRKVKKK